MLVTPLAGVSGGGAVIAHVNVTDRKKAQQRFRLVVEAAPSGMVMYDRHGKIVLVNSRAEKLFGYERRELLGQPVEILALESSTEAGESLRAVFAEPLVRPRTTGQDLYARRKDGARFPVEVELNPVETEEGTCVLSSIMDITERRRTEEERQKFVSLADRSLEFIGMCGLDFKPFYVNSAGMRLVGLENLEAACALQMQDYVFPEDRPFIVGQFLPRVLREGHGKVEIRFRHFKTGEPIWILYNVFSICDRRGTDIGWATVSVDITERKQAESALKDSRRELRALAGRLINAEEEERKRISRELHDDLSQKLALLAFDTGGLLTAPLSPEAKDQLLHLRTHIVQLAQDVRQISHQLHPSVLEDLGLTAALREMCEEFSAREGIEVAFNEQNVPQALPVEVASCLYRVAQEALHNVLKHAQTRHAQVTVRGCPDGVRLSIQDAGVGFDSEAALLRHGLGIVSMKERVRLVQGEFSIHSRPGKGAEVGVFVPLPR
jgi:PAS domain S-box-containing protein